MQTTVWKDAVRLLKAQPSGRRFSPDKSVQSDCRRRSEPIHAFDLLMHDGDDLRRQPLRERKFMLSKLLIRSRDGIQYVEHTQGHGEKLFEAVCDLGLEGIASKRLKSVYRSGPSKTWIKVKNPKSPAATRAVDGTF